jgi:hypothetical protein
MKEKIIIQTKFWKGMVIVLGIISLSTGLFSVSKFWSSYVLDLVGPAWGYVLIRVQYRMDSERFMKIRFSPEMALLSIISICFIIEAMQYYNLYYSTFDPYDLLAYFSGTFVVYLIDKILIRKRNSLQQHI